MSGDPANPFWDFSLRVYGRPGVAEACLRLQDRHDLDVNLLLYFCWLAGIRDRALAAAEIEQAVAATEAWRVEVVKALRVIRRRMKSGFEGMPRDRTERLRKQVQRLELDCEQAEQDFLFQRENSPVNGGGGPDIPPREAMQHATHNAMTYLAVLEVEPDAADSEDCRIVAESCFCPPKG